MGSQLCAPTQQPANNQPVYDYDQKEIDVVHPLRLEFRPSLKKSVLQDQLKEYENTLIQKKTMFLDRTIGYSENLLLKATDKQIKCNYLRPYMILKIQKSNGYDILEENQLISFSPIQRMLAPDTIVLNDSALQYLSMFLCFLSRYPKLIAQIIRTKSNNYGVHVVRMIIDSGFTDILIDDKILCNEETKQPIFSYPINGTYLWPCIIEKAWLKMQGLSERKILRMSPEQVFDTFISLPYKKIFIRAEDPEQFESHLSIETYNPNKEYILSARAHPKHQIGLLGGKYFYLLHVFSWEHKTFYYLRDPCAEIEFRGKHQIPEPPLLNGLYRSYGYMSERVPPVGLSLPAGNFLLTSEEMLEQIDRVIIFQYDEELQMTAFNIPVDDAEDHFIQFDLLQSGKLNLSVEQKIMEGEKYHPLTYHLVEIKKSKLAAGLSNDEAYNGTKSAQLLQGYLEQGSYLLRLKAKPPPSKRFTLVLKSYFPVEIRFERIDSKKGWEIFAEFLKEEGRRLVKINQPEKRKRKEKVDHEIFWIGDLAMFYLFNSERTNDVSVEVCFPELTNLECLSHKIKKADYFNFLLVKDELLIFEKIDLAEETKIKKYYLEAY